MYRGSTKKGDKMGRKLGFPTLNLSLSPCDMGKIFSKNQAGNSWGVFVVKVFSSEISEQNSQFFGLLHLGSRPTFNKPELRVEIFLLNFSEKNKEISENSGIHFQILQKIRDIQKFNSPEDLIQQIKKDVKTAEIFLGK